MEEVQNKSGGYTTHFLFLELLSKHALSFIGLSYIFGFIIVNSYLASFGLVKVSHRPPRRRAEVKVLGVTDKLNP